MADNSTQERLKGKTNEVAGGAKEKLGDAINNEEMESSGQTQQIKGKTQGLHADAKDTVDDAKNAVRDAKDAAKESLKS